MDSRAPMENWTRLDRLDRGDDEALGETYNTTTTTTLSISWTRSMSATSIAATLRATPIA